MSPADQDPAFEVLSSELRFTGNVISVRTDQVRMPDGSVAAREVVVHPGAVAILALDADDQVVLVRQYRHPIHQHLLELPAGLLDVDGEPALVGAQRELYEEAGLRAARWSVLVDLHTSPGMTDEAIRVFLARDLTEVGSDERFAAEHEEVTMTVERRPLDHLAAQVLTGELTNATTVAGIMAATWARQRDWQDLRPPDAAWPARPDRAGHNPS
ncbi:MAG: nudF [Frankiales bacterium]|nr:nudF [Frankiales bacterium]